MFPYQLKILASYEKNKDKKKEKPVQLPNNKEKDKNGKKQKDQ